ncbi:unnamed protein product [Prunus armeniaca]|uniref:Uncharacterized protein n=1 Tax=Prunus armeniaca TaxID=36596 RepID=A0A6J5USG4_PRUAR|nr:unnamed protein product [Prunus armeniaca]CAB4309207.1 unnamed protein product [Prunus armeniaca]
MASSWEKRIYSKELEFVGRYGLIYYQKKVEGDACALVAIANALSLMNKLGSTSKAKTMNDLRTLVAAQLRMDA